jgi:AraC-like DNA-binding protein
MPGYREFAPPAELAPWVEAVWMRHGEATTDATADEPVHRVLPDGRIDFLFDFRRTPKAVLVGTMTRCLLVGSEPDEDFLGVRFRPGGAAALLGRSMASFTNRQPLLVDLLGRGIEKLANAMARSAPEKRLDVLFDELVERAQRAAAPSAVASAAAARLDELHGVISVYDLARGLGVTRQHLTRRFHATVGIGPKTYARVMRFQAARAYALSGQVVDWADIAGCSGYADQSHLIAEFRRFAGLTPRRLASV